ncbi:MAG: SoxR reducing system RseC family protein [Candidatus Omnitrophota bacterium]|nr:SoxR reducing system RseC family protein [Candidatus Omnitrophota bacterium]
MKEKGKVIRTDSGTAVIETIPEEVCTKCCSCAASRPRRVTVRGRNAEGLRVGDRVHIEVEAATMLRLYFLLYGLPLSFFVGTAFLLHAVFHSPVLSFFSGLAATVLVYLGVGIYLRRNRRFSPDICVKGDAPLGTTPHT